MRKIRILVLAGTFLVVAVAGCGKAPAGGKVVAKINNYELTTDDFGDEMRLTAINKDLPADPKKAKLALLDGVIAKKVLLQEAQRENFDKDRAFMKEIERYWEQALIKLMIRKKMDEIARSVTVDGGEIRDAYEKMSREAAGAVGSFESMASGIQEDLRRRKTQERFDEWFSKVRSEANVKIYEENL